jgi:hypothetical protein
MQNLSSQIQQHNNVSMSKIAGFLSGLSVFFVGSFFLLPTAHAGNDHIPEVKIYSSGDLALANSFLAFTEKFRGGVDVAAGDVDGDGKDEVIAAAGFGGGPHVLAFNMDGSQSSFNHSVFHHAYRGGVSVASGDVDGDGRDEIVVSQASGEGWVKVYKANGVIISSFLPYGENHKAGVNVAVGDINGNGRDEIITGSGIGSRSHVRSFDQHGNFTGISIFPFPEGFTGGTDVAAGDVTGDGRAEIVIGAATRGTGQVLTYKADGSNSVLGNFVAYPSFHKGGVRVAVGDIDRDGKAEIVTGVGSVGGPQIRAFEYWGEQKFINFFSYPLDMRGGVHVAIGDLDNDPTLDIIVGPSWHGARSAGGPKRIDVNLSEQRLRVFEGDVEVKSFLISSGVSRFATPTGHFSVLQKIPIKRYQWSYGPAHPDNYNLPNVQWNMRIVGPIYIHGAYWHNNFGNRMSHGCINMRTSEAKWVYDWADAGTPVHVHY